MKVETHHMGLLLLASCGWHGIDLLATSMHCTAFCCSFLPAIDVATGSRATTPADRAPRGSLGGLA